MGDADGDFQCRNRLLAEGVSCGSCDIETPAKQLCGGVPYPGHGAGRGCQRGTSGCIAVSSNGRVLGEALLDDGCSQGPQGLEPGTDLFAIFQEVLIVAPVRCLARPSSIVRAPEGGSQDNQREDEAEYNGDSLDGDLIRNLCPEPSKVPAPCV